MKICFLAPANSVHSHRWIKYFADKGYEIHWISLATPSIDSIENVDFYEIKRFPIKAFQILLAVPRVRKLIESIQPEILHVHSAGTYGLVGALSKFHPIIVTAWGSDVLIAGKSKIKRPLIKFALSKGDLITCDAEHMRAEMTRLGVEPKKIHIVYFGTDTEKFNPGERSEKLRHKLGIFNSPLIISLRSLEPIYDIESLINSIPHVLKEIPIAKFVIGGTGSSEGKLNRLAKSLGVSESVRFVGQISNDELPQYLVTSDIYISTSSSDAGLAASTAEAMACGLPVIITDFGENKIWVKDGENGFLVPIKDPKMLAEKIIYILRNKEVRERFGKSNRKIIEERNNYQIEMHKMENIYIELLYGKNDR
jgi:glycosyltransferase involved in cell wall biosynthesis